MDSFILLKIFKFQLVVALQMFGAFIVCEELLDTIIYSTPARDSSGPIEYYFGGIMLATFVEGWIFVRALNSGKTLVPKYRVVLGVAVLVGEVLLLLNTIYMDQDDLLRCQMETDVVERKSRKVNTNVLVQDQPPCQEYTLKIVSSMVALVSGIAYIVIGRRTFNAPSENYSELPGNEERCYDDSNGLALNEQSNFHLPKGP